MEATSIGWTARPDLSGTLIPGFTQNFWLGCTEKEYFTSDGKSAIDPACINCYARGLMQDRFNKVQWGNGNPRVRTHDKNGQKPYRWNRKALKLKTRLAVFCESLSDLFDQEVEEQWFLEAWSVIIDTPDLEWLLLTKRIEFVHHMLYEKYRLLQPGQTLAHVRIGTTIAHHNLYVARAQPLADLHRMGWSTFYSCEPLLSKLTFDFSHYPVDWVIVGGESKQPKRGAHPCHLEHLQSAVEQCAVAEIPIFVKQAGDNPYLRGNPIKLYSPKGEDIRELPSCLQIQQLPPLIPLTFAN